MLNLLIIRSAIPSQLSEFYAHSGYNFDYHQHGNGPWHYAGNLGGLTLEIYPLKQPQPAPDKHLRLGFVVAATALLDFLSRLFRSNYWSLSPCPFIHFT